jgi:uncharacterized protein
MQSASPTPKDLKIEPRNVMFARNKGTDRWWNSRNPIATAFYNSLSLTFPKGEAFFIDSVRHYRDAVPAELQSQIDAFIKQEAAHSREHGVFNGQVERTGYDTARMHAEVERRLAKRKKSPLSNLFTTAAMEHLTAIIAHALLKDERHMKGASRDAARLWKWHAIEEIEHKAVAYDTLLAATQHLSGYKRWKFRSLRMLAISYAFLRARLRELGEFFKQDGIDDANSISDFVVHRSAFKGLLNLHAIWSSEDNRTEVTVWAKNVNNKRAVINSQDLSNLFDTVGEFNSGGLVFVANYNEPRTVGISLTQRF